MWSSSFLIVARHCFLKRGQRRLGRDVATHALRRPKPARLLMWSCDDSVGMSAPIGIELVRLVRDTEHSGYSFVVASFRTYLICLQILEENKSGGPFGPLLPHGFPWV